jgi:hypothetical protein
MSHQHSAEIRKSTKVESRDGEPHKTGKLVDPRADFWDREQHSQLNFTTLLWEELTTESCS